MKKHHGGHAKHPHKHHSHHEKHADYHSGHMTKEEHKRANPHHHEMHMKSGYGPTHDLEHDTGMMNKVRERAHFGKDAATSIIHKPYPHRGGLDIKKCMPTGKMS